MVEKIGNFLETPPFVLRGHEFPRTKQGRELARRAKLVPVAIGQGEEIFRCPAPEIKEPAEMWDPIEELFEFKAARQAKPGKKTVHEVSASAKTGLDELLRRAENGDGKALWKFAQITIEAVEKLNTIAKESPSLLEPFARNLCAWPVMMSNHPHLRDKTDWLSGLGLGESSVIQLDRLSKWHPDEAASIAAQLLRHIYGNRFCTDTMKLFDVAPDFSEATWKIWWDVARVFLLETYPKPEDVDEFKRIVKPATPRKNAPKRKTASKLSTPGRLRQAIFDQIKAKFKAFAIYSSVKQPKKLSLNEVKANVGRMREELDQRKKLT